MTEIKIDKEAEKLAEQIMKLPPPRIIFSIEFDEEEIQSFAEANFDRELTEIELNRMEYWWEDDDASWAQTELLASVIKMVMDTELDWSEVDDYQSSKIKAENKS